MKLSTARSICTYDIRQKECNNLYKFVRRNLIRQRTSLLWFAFGFVREVPDTDLRRFLSNAPQFGEHATFSRQKAPQSLDCGALQAGALRCSHQSAAHTVGEKQRTCRHIFKCCRGTFVAFFLTYALWYSTN